MSILDEILGHKVAQELPARKRLVPLREMRQLASASPLPRPFGPGLERAQVALIAEVKRASPSKGDLIGGEFQPERIARTYAGNGAAAISVLTDERFFKGSLDVLRRVRAVTDLPLLRKDFVVDEYQIHEARWAGADAVLLIAAALDDAMLTDFMACAASQGLAALVEVHDAAEAERALQVGAVLVGVNNRDLATFKVDIDTTRVCAAVLRGTADVSHPITIVSESGIFSSADVRAVARMGASAVLVGESLITAGDMADLARQLASVDRYG